MSRKTVTSRPVLLFTCRPTYICYKFAICVDRSWVVDLQHSCKYNPINAAHREAKSIYDLEIMKIMTLKIVTTVTFTSA
jgi:hypothetical protein